MTHIWVMGYDRAIIGASPVYQLSQCWRTCIAECTPQKVSKFVCVQTQVKFVVQIIVFVTPYNTDGILWV